MSREWTTCKTNNNLVNNHFAIVRTTSYTIILWSTSKPVCLRQKLKPLIIKTFIRFFLFHLFCQVLFAPKLSELLRTFFFFFCSVWKQSRFSKLFHYLRINNIVDKFLSTLVKRVVRIAQLTFHFLGFSNSRHRHVQLSMTEHLRGEKNTNSFERLALRFVSSKRKNLSYWKLFAFHSEMENVARRRHHNARYEKSLSFMWATGNNCFNNIRTGWLHDVPCSITVSLRWIKIT